MREWKTSSILENIHSRKTRILLRRLLQHVLHSSSSSAAHPDHDQRKQNRAGVPSRSHPCRITSWPLWWIPGSICISPGSLLPLGKSSFLWSICLNNYKQLFNFMAAWPVDNSWSKQYINLGTRKVKSFKNLLPISGIQKTMIMGR